MEHTCHEIKVCCGGSCRRNFSSDTLQMAEKTLGTKVGTTTADGKYNLSMCGCLGNCTEGPSVMIDDTIYGRMMPNDIKEKLNNLKANNDM